MSWTFSLLSSHRNGRNDVCKVAGRDGDTDAGARVQTRSTGQGAGSGVDMDRTPLSPSRDPQTCVSQGDHRRPRAP